jgi:glycosyltransferase involved in cell wall biosynthesis
VPSLWPEPFGLVGLEAAAHGVPAVAFDTGGISEWLTDGVNGRLVSEYGSAEALGAVLADLLRDSVQLQKLGHGAACAARRLSLPAHVDAIERILTTVRRQ